jgi:peptidoglycan/xylan/chitin deacetylase (PgdA/CDA1 family)
VTFLHTRAVQRWASRHMRCRVERVPDRFALTFDDGPSARNTPRLLEVLAGLGVRATFFVLAGHVLRHPEIVRAARDAGHELGVHGRTHLPPLLFPGRMLAAELETSAQAVEAACGERPRRYRAPFGLLTASQARAVRAWGFETVLGDVYPEDPHLHDGREIARRALARIDAGSILILHDASVFGDASRTPTIEAVEQIVTETSRRGLRAVTVAELVSGASAASPSPGR